MSFEKSYTKLTNLFPNDFTNKNSPNLSQKQQNKSLNPFPFHLNYNKNYKYRSLNKFNQKVGDSNNFWSSNKINRYNNFRILNKKRNRSNKNEEIIRKNVPNYSEKKEEIYFNKNDFFGKEKELKTENSNLNYFTYDKLNEINNKETSEIIKIFLENLNLASLFSQSTFSENMIYLMLQILRKISENNTEGSNQIIIEILENTNFISNEVKRLIEEKLIKMEINDLIFFEFIDNLISFHLKFFNKLPNIIGKLKTSDISEIIEVIELLLEESDNPISEIKKSKLNSIIEKYKIWKKYENNEKEIRKQKFLEKINKKKSNIFSRKGLPPIDYQQKNISLTKKEIKENLQPKILPQLKKGAFDSYPRYINTMFYLMREDIYRNIRKSINIIKDKKISINKMESEVLKQTIKDNQDIFLYLNGEIIDFNINIITLDFYTPFNKKVKFSKRLIYGSLIILTDNDFNDYLLTTVYVNPYIQNKINKKYNKKNEEIKLPQEPKYRILLKIVEITNDSIKFIFKNINKKLQIFESKAYFESYIHILKRLQSLNYEDLPFENEIVKNIQKKTIPYYIKNKDLIYNNEILNPIKNIYPESLINSLDKSQLNALKNCLTSSISLIQGPPGTGKTHLGVKITEIILQNLPEDAKILVVCYLNNALDQFLEGILNYTKDIMRIGGRCKNEKILPFVFSPITLCKNMLNVRKKLESIGQNMMNFTKLIDKRTRINADELEKISPKILNKIYEDFFDYIGINKNLFLYRVKLTKNNKNLLLCEFPQNYNSGSNNFELKEKVLKKEIYTIFNFCDYEKLENFLYDLLIKCFFFDDHDKGEEYFNKIKKKIKYYGNDNIKVLNNLKILSRNVNKSNQNQKNNVTEINNKEENIININNYEGEDSNQINKMNGKNNIKNNVAINEDEKLNKNIINQNIKSQEDEEIIISSDNPDESEDNDNDDIDELYGNLDGMFDNQEKYSDKNITNQKEIMFDEISNSDDSEILNDEKIEILLDKTNNINWFTLGKKLTNLIGSYLKNKYIEIIDNSHYEKLIKEFNRSTIKYKELVLLNDSEQIENIKIVGMTTTGFSKYATIFENFNFEVVILEEAAEVLEPHILSLLTKNTKHLIMIGDHKQLRPKPNNNELAYKYNFDTSMFERLVNNNWYGFSSLSYQRRMKPKFADFVRIIYGEEKYIDHETTKNNEPIKGIEKDMFIITHKYPENECMFLKSIYNQYEAEYVIKLYEYLLKQNYTNEQIIILTFYTGQVIEIKRILKENKINNIRVSSVDSFQGEESDIVLLSLVRSNKDNKIGFLRSFNRVCVAFSRAKIGFYIIGNIDSIIEGEINLEKRKLKLRKNEEKMKNIWRKIKQKAIEYNCIGDELVLCCQNHHTKTIIKNIKDFSLVSDGGCRIPCRERLKCGHFCEKFCHAYDHDKVQCYKPCVKIFEECGHPCSKKCYEDCGKCMKLVSKKLLCSHSAKVECGLKLTEVVCNEKCNKILECGHQCTGTCGKCLQGTLHIKCTKECGKQLFCGHICKQKCSGDCLCEEKCPNICPHGYCLYFCSEKCEPCIEPCVLSCEHSFCTKQCGELCDRKPCNKRCNKKMKCGHQCIGLCGERCINICRICDPKNEIFDIFFGNKYNENALFYKTKCGHVIEYKVMDKYFESYKEIKMYKCPKCNSFLTEEPRYQNYIKVRFEEIQNIREEYIKKKLLENKICFKKNIAIINKVKIAISFGIIEIFNFCSKTTYFNPIKYNNTINLKDKLPYTMKLIEKFDNTDNDENKKNMELVTTYNLLTLLKRYIGIEYLASEIKLKSENLMSISELKYILNYNIIKNYFTSFNEFNSFFFRKLKIKIDNMLYFALLILSGKNEVKNIDIKITPNKLAENNFADENIKLNKFFSYFNKDKEVKILKKLRNTWYKCPNGHYYSVEKCGKSVEIGDCPICKQNKGQMNHMPLQTNKYIELNRNNIYFEEFEQEKIGELNNSEGNYIDDDTQNLWRGLPSFEDYW